MINMSCLHFGSGPAGEADIKAVLTTDRPTDGTKRSADRLTEQATDKEVGRPPNTKYHPTINR